MFKGSSFYAYATLQLVLSLSKLQCTEETELVLEMRGYGRMENYLALSLNGEGYLQSPAPASSPQAPPRHTNPCNRLKKQTQRSEITIYFHSNSLHNYQFRLRLVFFNRDELCTLTETRLTCNRNQIRATASHQQIFCP
jgi:hypothetical protein